MRPRVGSQGDHRSSGHDEVEVGDHGLAFAILELDVLKTDLPHDGRCVARIGLVGFVVLHSQDFEHPFHGREGTLQFGKGIDDVPNRVQQEKGVPLECHDVANGRAAHDVQVSAVPDDHDVDRAEQQAPRSPQDHFAAVCEHLFAQHGMPATNVFEQFAHLAPEGTHDANAGKRLAHAAVNPLHVFADDAVDGSDASRKDKTHQHHARNDRQRRQRQPPVQRQQQPHGDDQADDRDGGRHDGHLQQAGRGVHVPREAGQNAAGLHVPELGQRQMQQPLEE